MSGGARVFGVAVMDDINDLHILLDKCKIGLDMNSVEGRAWFTVNAKKEWRLLKNPKSCYDFLTLVAERAILSRKELAALWV